MGGLQRLKGQWARREAIVAPGRYSFLRVQTDDGETAPITVVIEPERVVTDIADPALESEAQAIIEYGADQGNCHMVTLDCSRGLVFTISCVHLQVDLVNIGGGQVENIPTRTWRGSASIGATARVTPATAHERIDGLAREAFSPFVFVPQFAFAWSLPRTPQGPMQVEFRNGAGGVLADYFIPRNETPQHPVPSGADRVRVRALDDGLTRGRLQFELAL